MPIFPPDLDPLFSERSLTTLLRGQIAKMELAINELGDDVFLQNSPEDLIETIMDIGRLQPLVLLKDSGISHPPIQIDNLVPASPVPIIGFRYMVEVPYTGASGLLNHQPERFDLDKPRARRNAGSMQGSLFFSRVASTDVPSEQIKAAIDAEMAKVQKYIDYQALQIDPFNASLRDEALKIVNGRRDRLLKARDVAASLGYPLYQRNGAPVTYVSPVIRRKIVTNLSGTFKPEPTILQSEYQNILRIIESMSFVMERNPKVFSIADEQTIRDHYLVQLNGQYEGSATGETFNGSGKTDIIVRDGNANLFIAECKIWHGQKEFIEATDQLFGYVTWRDTKTAIIVFNRNQATTPVVDTIEATIKAHANYKRDAKREGETRLRAVFGRPDDPARELIVTVLVVPIPKPEGA
jgi:hypothetical protein